MFPLKPNSSPDKKLKQELAEAKTQIKHALAVPFPEAESHFNVFSQSFLNILSFYPSPQTTVKAEENKIAQIQELEKFLEEQIHKEQQKQLQSLSSIKGISSKLAARFLAEIEEIQKFSKAKKLIKYAGCDPVTKQSGKWKVEMSISKQGNPHLHNILFQMAGGVVKWQEGFRAYFRRKYEQFGSYKKAMIAVVNKLIRVIYALCSRNQLFDPSKFITAEAAYV